MYNLRDFGSYTAGGRIAQVTTGEPYTVNFTRSASYEVDPRGHFAVEHAYVQYFIPEARNDDPPIVLVHGGGMCGTCWETTPDGRPGWLHLLLQRGFEVHVVDAVERGRAGFAPGLWSGAPILRSLQEAWRLFRIGPDQNFPTRTPFAGQLFPVEHFEAFARSFVPRWLSTTQLQSDALAAVLQRTGPATVFCHSQGGEIVFDVLARAPENIAHVVAIEPSGLPEAQADLHERPVTLVTGGFLDCDEFWSLRASGWAEFAAFAGVTAVGRGDTGSGHSHVLMSNVGSDHVLDEILDTL